MDKQFSAYLLKLRREHPFLATLSLHINFKFSERVRSFEADGKDALIHPQYFSTLNADQRTGTLLHTTLHCALLHGIRCGARSLPIWNIAADIVVNDIIAESGFKPPPGTAVEPRYSGLSVEQVYVRLLAVASNLRQKTAATGLESECEPSANDSGTVTNASDPAGKKQDAQLLTTLYKAVADLSVSGAKGPNAKLRRSRLESHWQKAMTRAQTVDRLNRKNQGDLPLGLLREIDLVLHPQLDWKTLLWRFMAKTPCDFNGFDRRFIHHGLYLDHLEGESLQVHIAMDTSGSISQRELAQFRAEVEAIVRCYGNIDALLYFVDAEVYGPYPLGKTTQLPGIKGGGGTDFSEFFEQLEPRLDPFSSALCVYLTDGYGTFPEQEPSIPVLWVASSEGSHDYPFGEVALLGY